MRENIPIRWFILPAFGVAVLITLWTCVTIVPAGHAGVVMSLGKVQSDILDEGVHLLAPWQRVHALSVRTQERKETADVPTNEGLTAKVDLSLLYSLKREQAAEIYQKVGPDYLDVVVLPQLRSAMRGATVKFRSEDLYTTKREALERELELDVMRLLDGRGVTCERVLIRSVTLPETVRQAIDQKVAAEQRRLQMQIELTQAKTEAEKKLVEAQSTRDAQKLISETLSENYLRYQWVRALEQAAQNKATLIYVPTGPAGMPTTLDISRTAMK